MADFASNLHSLLAAAGIPHPISENVLGIERLRFIRFEKPNCLDVPASQDNRASRLFIELLARQEFHGDSNPSHLQDLDRFQTVAQQFYSQHWNDRIGTGVHPIIDGLRGYQQVEIIWKEGAKPRSLMSFDDLLRHIRGE